MNNENKMSMAERIYELRKESGKSQGEIADMLNVSRQSVSKWENGTSNPEIENLVSLSKIFGVTVDEIINYNPDNEACDFQNKNIQQQKNSNAGAIMLVCGILVAFIGLFIHFAITIAGGVCGIIGLFMLTFRKGEHLFNSWIAYAVLYAIFCWFSTGGIFSFVYLLLPARDIAQLFLDNSLRIIINVAITLAFCILALITILKGKGVTGKTKAVLFLFFFYSATVLLHSVTSFAVGWYQFAIFNVVAYGGFAAVYLYCIGKKKLGEKAMQGFLYYMLALMLYGIILSISSIVKNGTGVVTYMLFTILPNVIYSAAFIYLAVKIRRISKSIDTNL